MHAFNKIAHVRLTKPHTQRFSRVRVHVYMRLVAYSGTSKPRETVAKTGLSAAGLVLAVSHVCVVQSTITKYMRDHHTYGVVKHSQKQDFLLLALY